METTNETTNVIVRNKSKKWDNYLTDYENYLKEYISHYNKSLKGDQKSLALYPYMHEKTEILSNKLHGAQEKSFLTTNQLDRWEKAKQKNIVT